MADPISRNPTFSAQMQADVGAEANSSKVVSLPPPPIDTLSSVGESIKHGYAVDENFGKAEYIELHSLVKEDCFWYKGEQIAVPNVPGLQRRCI